MFEPDKKTTALLVKLNRLTSMDKLRWSVREPPASLSQGTNDFIPFYMEGVFKGQRFAIFQQRYQVFDVDREQTYWSEREVLAILDMHRRVLWETTQRSSALSDLFSTARRKVANIDEILDDLLNEDDES